MEKEYVDYSGKPLDGLELVVDKSSKIVVDDQITVCGKVKIQATNFSTVIINGNCNLGASSYIVCQNNSVISIRESLITKGANFFVINNSKLFINAETVIQNDCDLFAISGLIKIGEKTTIARGAEIRCHFTTIDIGEDNMFSQYTKIIAGDGHKIFDIQSEKLLTHKEPVTTGEHVWVGIGACLLSNSSIGTGCIIGAQSLVNKYIPPNSIAAGNPARILRNNVRWER